MRVSSAAVVLAVLGCSTQAPAATHELSSAGWVEVTATLAAAELNRYDWKGAQRVLFRTRSTLRGWMDSSFHKDFAYIAPDAAQQLADAGVKLVGVDYISAEQFGAPAPRTHQILLGRGIPIVEGLDLRPVHAGDYDLIVLPIKVRGHEGAPARAIVRRQN